MSGSRANCLLSMRIKSTVESRSSKVKEQRSPAIPALFLVSAGTWPAIARLSAEVLSWQRPCSARVSALSGDNPDPAPGVAAVLACWAGMAGPEHKRPMKRTETAAVTEFLDILH